MLDEVKACADAKINFFSEFFTVPSELEEDVKKFSEDTNLLGESCKSAAEFEEKFVSSGLSGRFNALFPKCSPKARKMTAEEKKNSAKIAADILYDRKEEIIKDAVLDTAGDIVDNQRDKYLNDSRERMIADGTYAENTIRQNNLDNVFEIGRLFKNIFKK